MVVGTPRRPYTPRRTGGSVRNPNSLANLAPPFQKGQVVNPGGRPKVMESVQATCRAFFQEGAGWDRVQTFALSRDPKVAWPVLETMLAYAYGRPTQTIHAPDGPFAQINPQVNLYLRELPLAELLELRDAARLLSARQETYQEPR